MAQSLSAGTALAFERPGPTARARLINPPSSQSSPSLNGESRWRLVSQLTLNHLSLVEGPKALDALREMLSLHNLRDEPSARRQISGLFKLNCERVVDQVGKDAWRGWRNGLEVSLQLNPEHFAGNSAVLFSGVLAQFFSLYATANRFVRTVLVDADKAGARNLKLGSTAIAGTRVWDEHAGIRLRMGPLTAEQAKPLLPEGSVHVQLADLAALYLGPDLDCALTRQIKGAQTLQLNRQSPPELNWNTGLQHQTREDHQQLIHTRLRQSLRSQAWN